MWPFEEEFEDIRDMKEEREREDRMAIDGGRAFTFSLTSPRAIY